MAITIIKKSIIYIGEDYNFISDIVQLSGDEFDVYQLAKPLEAFAWLKNSQNMPLLILIEQNCKGIDVFSFCELLSARFSKNNYRILMITNNNQPIDMQKARKNNVLDIIEKPLSKEQKNRFLSLIQTNYAPVKASGSSDLVPQSSFSVPYWKRSFDILFSGIAILLLSPILIMVAIFIKLDSKGPVLYASKRVGRGYKVFNFYKFRTMRTGADKELQELKKELNQYQKEQKEFSMNSCEKCSSEKCTQLVIDNQIICEQQFINNSKNNQAAFVKLKGDPRITKLGRFLRNTSIDELPQLFNILKGDMSIVGNRPLPLYEAELLTTDQDVQRFAAPAGLTGLWQVRKRGQDNMSEEERKKLDNTYAQNYSLSMDIKLIIQTVGVFVQKENV